MVAVFNCDERFAGVFAVSVLSLFENNQDAEEITVYLIEDRISDKSKKRFQEIADRYGREIIVIPMPDFTALAGMDIAIPSYNRMATCGRLFTASLLPKDIDKVIYADCDTIFVDSLAELWNTDISGYYAGMVNDGSSPAYRTMLGLSKEGIYYNSGILLINLKKWREDHIEKAFVDYMVSQSGYVPFPDQGVLNAVLDGKILTLPLRYNAFTLLYCFNYRELMRLRRPTCFYESKEVREAKKRPAMVHFTNCFYIPVRPWVKGSVHPYVQKYLAYRNMTPWKDEPLWEDRTPILKKIYSVCCHIVPRRLMIISSSFIREDLIPIMHKYKKWKHCRLVKKSEGGGYSLPLEWMLVFERMSIASVCEMEVC